MSIRRIFKGLGIAAAAIVLLALGGLFALLARPEWFLTPRVVTFAIRTFGGEYQPSWSKIGFQIRSQSLLKKEIDFSAADLCFIQPNTTSGGCFKEVDLRIKVRITKGGIRIPVISRVNVEGDRFVVDLIHRVVQSKKERKGAFRLPTALQGVELGRVTIHLPQIRVVESASAVRTSIDMRYEPFEARALRIVAHAQGRNRGAKGRMLWSASLHGISDLRTVQIDSSLKARSVRTQVALRARRIENGAISIHLTTSGHAGVLTFKGRADGTHKPSADLFEGALSVHLSSGPVQQVGLGPFRLTTVYEQGETMPRALQLSSRFQASVASLSSGPVFRVPPKIAGHAVVSARLVPTEKQKDRFSATLTAKLDPYQNWYSFGGVASVGITGRLGDLKSSHLQHDIDLSFSVPKFETLTKELASSKIAVPAPFAALKGPIMLRIQCSGDPSRQRQTVVYRLTTNLAAQRQRLRARVDGTLDILRPLMPSRRLSNEILVRLEDVALELPRIDPARLPAIKLDSRIARPGQSPSKPTPRHPSLALSSGVRVTTEKPVLIYSNLTTDPIPLTINLRASIPPPTFSGNVAAGSFEVRVFRRQAKVDHFRITRSSQSAVNDLDGLILYDAQEAQVRIRLVGTTEKPHVVLESDPPLNQSEIVSLLLYGKSPNNLDPDQQSTVSNTQSAMTDQAFGLASLYLFASTPIEYVGFDPASRTYSMKFKIAGGASVELGSDLEASRSVQVRKRLAAHFAIQAQARDTPMGSSVGTFLEWFNRY